MSEQLGLGEEKTVDEKPTATKKSSKNSKLEDLLENIVIRLTKLEEKKEVPVPARKMASPESTLKKNRLQMSAKEQAAIINADKSRYKKALKNAGAPVLGVPAPAGVGFAELDYGIRKALCNQLMISNSQQSLGGGDLVVSESRQSTALNVSIDSKGNIVF